MTDMCICEYPSLESGVTRVCAECGGLLDEGTEEADSIEAMAWDVYEAWKDNYDGPEGDSLEDVARRLFHAVDEASLLLIAERARVIADDQSYFDCFGTERPTDGSKPPGYYVHSTRIPPIFPHESYEETARKDGVM